MAYSNKIHLKEYRYFRYWMAIKKILLYFFGVGFSCIVLFTSQYCTTLNAVVIATTFSIFLFKKMKLHDFFESEWDGVVIEKTAQYDKKPKAILLAKGSAFVFLKAYKCTLIVKRDCNGKLYKSNYVEYVYDGFNTSVRYFRQGEKVRHHRCLPLYEKLDKSKERKLLCFKCGRFADKYEEKCWHCGLPVLSEGTEYVKKTHTLAESEKRLDRIW